MLHKTTFGWSACMATVDNKRVMRSGDDQPGGDRSTPRPTLTSRRGI
jgi:hypothetical protein